MRSRPTRTSGCLVAFGLALSACSSSSTETLDPIATATTAPSTASPALDETGESPSIDSATTAPSTPSPALDETGDSAESPSTDPAGTPSSTSAPDRTPETTAASDSAPATEAATDFAALPPQPAGVPFPTERWPEGSIPAGVDVDRVAGVMDETFGADDSRYGQIDAVLVVRDGEIVLERYDDDYPADQPHDSWSIAKSVTHAALGVLVRDGLLDVDAPAAIDEWAGDDRAAITPALLARMSSGLSWEESNDAFQLVGSASSTNAAARQIDRPLAGDVGSVFNYSTGSTAVNGRIMGDLVGTGDDFRSWIDAELFEPLGMRSPQLLYDGDDYWVAGYGANMTARDFARFGLLYLRDGMWDGTRILPAGWVDDARTPSTTSDAYGAGFWIDLNADGTFSAEGFLGQKIVLVPDADLLVVVLSNNLDAGRSAALTGELVELFRVT